MFNKIKFAEILKRIVDNSKGITTYIELMEICGYLRKEEVKDMFDKERFADILEQINTKYTSMTKFANHAGIDRGYLSRNMNSKLENPPGPDILRGIADSSYGTTTYVELLEVCGYLNEDDLREIREKDNPYNEILAEATTESDIEEVINKVRELVELLERANELINSLSKK